MKTFAINSAARGGLVVIKHIGRLLFAFAIAANAEQLGNVQSISGQTGQSNPSFAHAQPLTEVPQPPTDCCGGSGAGDKRLLPGPVLPTRGLPSSTASAETPQSLQIDKTNEVQAAADFTLFRNEIVPSAATGSGSTSEVMEPSVGSAGRAVFQTGNWFSSLSSDNGASWTYVNPYTMFPTTGAFSGGFCCDQRVVHDRSREMVVWYLQYGKTGSSATDQSGVRIAVARSEANLLANSWTYYDFTPASFGIGLGEWFDFPHLQVTSQFLYATSNLFSTVTGTFTRTVIVRIPLNELKIGGTINFTYWKPTATWSDAFAIAPVNGATDTMYFASIVDSTSIRVYNVPDSGSTLNSQTVGGLATTNFATHISIAPDGNNWTGRSDSRIQTGWVAAGQVGFMWNSAQGTNRPQPFIRAVTLSTANLSTVTGQPEVWNSTFAWHYPAIAVNARGDIGGVAFAGGPSFAPETQVLIDDLYTSAWEAHFTGSGTNAGNSRWGDYLGAQADDKYPNTWIATGYTLNGPANGGGSNAGIRARFFWFGRQGDTPGIPGNDLFANRTTITGLSGTTSGSNVGASKEAGEPNHSSAGGASVWWVWTAPSSGPATISTIGSAFDTLLAVYTGTAVGSLTLIASNDDGGGAGTSLVTFSATAGTSYKIAVDGYNGASGTIQLNWSVANVPTVTNPTYATGTLTSATLGGNVTTDGGSPVTERGVVYSISGVNNNPIIGGTGVTKVTSTGTTGIFTVVVTGLTQGIDYSFKAYATNSVGSGYSVVTTFAPGVVWVDFSTAVDGVGTFAEPCKTMASGAAKVPTGGNLKLKGPRTTTEAIRITKGMRIEAVGGTAHFGN